MRQARFVLIDDIDGSVAEETVSFAVAKQQYEIDLNSAHLAEFNAAIEKWVEHARKVANRRGSRSTATVGANDAGLIRAWAQEKGIALSQRGRIPTSVREQYYAESAQQG